MKAKPKKNRLLVHFYNGSKTKEAWDENSPHFIDDWKPESCDIECDMAQITYRDHVKIYDKEGADILSIFWSDDGFLEHDGVYYGDVSISAL